eukprot:scaffold440_cov277-Ochromonas_danica.AAC.30
MKEVLLQSTCQTTFLPPINHTITTNYDIPTSHNTHLLPQSPPNHHLGSGSGGSGSGDLYLLPSPISEEVIRWYLSLPPPRSMRVDPGLCAIIPLSKRPIFNNTSGCQLKHYMSPYAPRCQVSYLKEICRLAQCEVNDTRLHSYILPEADHRIWTNATTTMSSSGGYYPSSSSINHLLLPPQPFLLAFRNGYVTQCGQASLPCGIVHPSTTCFTVGHRGLSSRFHRQCGADSNKMKKNKKQAGSKREESISTTTSNRCSSGTPFSSNISDVTEQSVFVIAEIDDTYTYHIHLEIAPRLVYHLPFLQANPDVKILYGCDYKKNSQLTLEGLNKGLQSLQLFLSFFNITNPILLQQNLYSSGSGGGVVYLPMEGGCQDPVYNTWHILHMRSVVMKELAKREGELQERYNHYLREVKKRQQQRLVYANLPLLLPPQNKEKEKRKKKKGYLVVLKRSSNSKFTPWIASKANVLIGVHGAGLGLMLYMSPNSAVIEIAPYGNDGRCLLGGGPFSRLATVMAHNYLIHYPR